MDIIISVSYNEQPAQLKKENTIGGRPEERKSGFLFGRILSNLTCFCSLSTISPTSALKVKERPLVLIWEPLIHCMENIDMI